MLRCSVCGKVFPEGQGIVIRAGGRDLVFHKKTCAARFLRELLPLLGGECGGAIDSVLKSFERSIEERRREKRIPGA